MPLDQFLVSGTAITALRGSIRQLNGTVGNQRGASSHNEESFKKVLTNQMGSKYSRLSI
jgi:hypothetical protein